MTNKLTKILATGLLGLAAACTSTTEHQPLRTPTNITVELSPQERQIQGYRDQFNHTYELALKSYATSQRTQNGDTVDKAVSASASRAYADHVAGMNSCIQELKSLHADTAYLEKIVSALPKQ